MFYWGEGGGIFIFGGWKQLKTTTGPIGIYPEDIQTDGQTDFILLCIIDMSDF